MSLTELRFVKAHADRPDLIGVLSLNRPDAANALNAEMLQALAAQLQAATANEHCRALVLRGHGKHFSAGADLDWMRAAAELDVAGNLRDAKILTKVFEALANLPMPTLALVHGSAFGGAVGLAACCDIVIASATARFCLSEVKLGLMPAVIMPYLARKMSPGQLRRHALNAKVFSGADAYDYGLVQRVTAEGDVGGEVALREELNALLQGSPTAQKAIKALHDRIVADSLKQAPYTAEGIATLRVSASGQAGLKAFFAQQATPWAMTLNPNWRLDVP